ncbi:acetoin utilization protein AcuC [Candidatus Geothermarchaeota archaeon ex4572_27]|nr:MAG: acetoin utilization protein AcuC [Candidatus Geothermarchaeota archaeon ex4572_27]
MAKLILYKGEVYKYGFPGHPLNPQRYQVFWEKLEKESVLKSEGLELRDSRPVDLEVLKLFHTEEHINFVRRKSEEGHGLLDYGDTPAFKGVYEVSLHPVGATVDAVESVIRGDAPYAFNPAGGGHHATRTRSAGFCVFNDVGVAIEYLFHKKLADRVYYVDIDAHHGDGVYYSFEEDPRVYIFDIHESGYYLYPGTGFEWERGRGPAEGTKVNVPLRPGATDDDLIEAINRAYEFGLKARPDIIIMQAGTDGLAGDPITHLMYTFEGHKAAVKKIKELADRTCGRLVVLGGGGYNLYNVSEAWVNVVKTLLGLEGK